MVLFVFFELCLMAFEKLFGAVFAAQLEDVVAHRRFNQYRKVSTDGDWQGDGTDVHIEDGLGFRAYAQAVKLLHVIVVGSDKVDNQLEDFFRTDRSFAENVADVEYAQTAHFKEIAQHWRAATFERFGACAEQLDRIIRNQAVSARNQFQRQLAFTQTGMSCNQHADFKYIEEYAVFDDGSCQRALQINPQHIHQIRAFELGSQQRDVVFMAVVAQFGRNRQTVGNDDQRHGDIEEFAEIVIQLARFETFEIFGFGNTDDLDLIGMDKIQMADQRQNGFVGLYSDAVVRTRIACRPSKLEFVLIIGKQAADGYTGHCLLFCQKFAHLLGGGRGHQGFTDGFLREPARQFGQDFQMLAGRIFRHQQSENQGDGFAVGRIESDWFFRADKRAGGFFHAGMTTVRNSDALSQAGRTQLFAGKQAVEDIAVR